MEIDVVLLPRDLCAEHLSGRTVLVLDVLRATTTMIAALAAGVAEIRIFSELDAAVAAARACTAPHLLCGERDALKPPGFDLGNGPGAFDPALHRGTTLFMTTTNGVRAILAAGAARSLFIAALVNAGAAADAVVRAGLDVTLLCAGTDGQIATEDVLGAGAIIDALQSRTQVQPLSDTTWMSWQLFRCHRHDLPAALRSSRGGQNVIRAALSGDIDFAAALDSVPVVGRVRGQPPVVTLCNPSP